MLETHLCIVTRATTLPKALNAWINGIHQQNWGLLIIDDGCANPLAQQLEQLSLQTQLHIIRLLHKEGLGIAMRIGMDEAQQLNYSHALWLPYAIELTPELIHMITQQVSLYPHALAFSAHERPYNLINTFKKKCLQGLGHQNASSTPTPWLRLYPLTSFNAMLAQLYCSHGNEYDFESLLHWQWQQKSCMPLSIAIKTPLLKKRFSFATLGGTLAMFCRLLGARILRLPKLWRHRYKEI